MVREAREALGRGPEALRCTLVLEISFQSRVLRWPHQRVVGFHLAGQTPSVGAGAQRLLQLGAQAGGGALGSR